ncbi:MAG TPA: sialidase family protein [Usitatibacter sp.]|nr:sialidase family protein [Usitatibacter sp.]
MSRRIAWMVLALAPTAGAADNPLARGAGPVIAVPHAGLGVNGIGRLPSQAAGEDKAITGPTPFVFGCDGFVGTLYVNAEVEPWIRVDPRDARHWIAAWQQDRWSNGSSRGQLTGVTFDAGATWTRAVPPLSTCAGGELERASDPWLDIAPDGTAHQVTIASTGDILASRSVSEVLATRSGDGGLTWAAPQVLIRDTGAFFNDKESLTADPTDPHLVYAVWDRLQQAASGPTYLARSTDGGASWEPARAIYDPGANQQTIGNLIRVLPDGTLVNLLTHLVGTNERASSATLEVIRSFDHGATWSAPVTIADYLPIGVTDAATHAEVRDGTPVAAMAVAPDGALYVVWQDGRFSGTADAIAMARSGDGGATWSVPVRVSSRADARAFAPQVHVAADGTIAVTYFDLRFDTPDPSSLPCDFWMARSRDGVSWLETHLAGPFDLLGAPNAGGLFLGDYTGLDSAAGEIIALHARTTGNPDNPTDLFVARVATDAPGVAYTASQKALAANDVRLREQAADALARAMERRPFGWLGQRAPPH